MSTQMKGFENPTERKLERGKGKGRVMRINQNTASKQSKPSEQEREIY